MVVREQSLVVQTVQQIRARLPFVMLGLDVDNDSAFINETMLAYCQEEGWISLDHGLIGTIRHGWNRRTEPWSESW